MYTELLDYQDNSTQLQAYVAFDKQSAAPRPAILVAHDWTGRNDFACDKARKLAEMGYVGFALDMFGRGVLGHDKDEKAKLIAPFMSDRAKLQQRINAAYRVLASLPQVDTNKIAVIGFCFGGLCALDLARSGAKLKGVVSFHGLLIPPENIKQPKIQAKVLAMHGHDDPMVTPDHVAAFQKEMTTAGVDWQMHIYGHAMHGFTNPIANDPNFGIVYNANAAQRSWVAMKNFLSEVFQIK